MRLHDAWEKNFTFYKKKQLLPVQSKLSFSVINYRAWEKNPTHYDFEIEIAKSIQISRYLQQVIS